MACEGDPEVILGGFWHQKSAKIRSWRPPGPLPEAPVGFPRRSGALRRGAEEHVPAQQASESLSRPTKAEKTKPLVDRRPRRIKGSRGTRVDSGYSGYLSG